jgi:hypothetical protein
MNYELCSTNWKNYELVKFDINFPVNCVRARYRITHFSTYANFALTEKDDKFSWVDGIAENYEISWIELGPNGNYGDRPTQLVDAVNKLIKAKKIQNVVFQLNVLGTLRFVITTLQGTLIDQYRLLPMSNRVRMLLGLYDKDPTTLISQSISQTEYAIDFPSAPMLWLGNVLYLISSNSRIVGVNDSKNGEYKLSIAYKYGEIMVPGCPMVSKKPGYWITCRSEDLSNVEFQLVDWQFNPIKILNPVHVSIELEFFNNPLEI